MPLQLSPKLRNRVLRSQTVGPVVLAVSVGLLAAGWAIVFRWLIALAGRGFFGAGGALTARLPDGRLQDLHILLAPAIGMVIVVLLVRRWAPEAKGHGVPEVQHAVRHKGGRLRARVVIVKAVASALSIGSGGSVGREGPIVQVGAALGSTVGQFLGLGPRQLRLLVACGAAGGIAATFNAPLAGVLFALEVILGSFAARSFGLVVISSVSATALSGAVLGRAPAFQLIQTFALISNRELLLYVILGAVVGLAAVVFIRSVYGMEALFDDWHLHPVVKGFIGGLFVGAIGFFGSTLVFGVGYEGIELALAGEITFLSLALLAVAKILATSVTLGAGGSGGVFAPALFIGAMIGGAFGHGAQLLFPAWTGPSGAYALVGMAALFGAAAHAPMTAVLILFEMTDDSQILLPLMLAVGVSYLVASSVFAESIYSLKLKRLGGDTEAPERSVLDMLLVADAMMEDVEVVQPEMAIDDLADLARRRRTRSWPVVTDDAELVGIVTETDLERTLVEGSPEMANVGDIMTTGVVTLRPGDTLRTAFRLFSERDMRQIPVVEDASGRRFVGALRRHEMLWAFKTVSDEHGRLLESKGPAHPLATDEVVHVQVPIHRHGSSLAGRRLRDAAFPQGTLVSLVRRAGGAFVPRGDTVLEAGDVLLILTTREHEEQLREWLRSADRPVTSGPDGTVNATAR
ncbi:MAG: chloride channel protein [Gemmatimonadota bacterium]